MIHIINQKGKKYFKKWKIESLKYIFLSPLVLVILSFLFVLGAKDKVQLVFSIFLICVFLVFLLFGFLKLLSNVNKTISSIRFESDIIEFRTIDILWKREKVIKADRKDITFRLKEFRQKRKLALRGWIIQLKKHNIELNLISDFFDINLEDSFKI